MEENPDEKVYSENRNIDRARRADFWSGVVHEKRSGRKTEQRRLLHLYDAPFGEVAGSKREVPYLQHAPGPSDERNWR
jgi:hypothetical protein